LKLQTNVNNIEAKEKQGLLRLIHSNKIHSTN